MSAEILQFRPFQSARDQAKKLGTDLTTLIVSRIRNEQRDGRTGLSVAHELQMRRLQRADGPDSPEAA